MLLIRGDFLFGRRWRGFEMQLIAQISLQITQWMTAILRRCADIKRKIRNTGWVRTNCFQYIRPVIDIRKLRENIRQPNLSVAD